MSKYLVYLLAVDYDHYSMLHLTYVQLVSHLLLYYVILLSVLILQLIFLLLFDVGTQEQCRELLLSH